MKLYIALAALLLPSALHAQTQISGPTVIQNGKNGQNGAPGPNCAASSPSGQCVLGNTTGHFNAVLNETLFTGATVTARVTAACTASATPLSPVIIPATETDTSLIVPSTHCQIIDYRGTTLPSSASATSGVLYGIANDTWETRQASTTTYTGFNNRWFYYAGLRGGVYTFGASLIKTDYFNVYASSAFDTLGQKTGIDSNNWSTANGETMGIQSYITEAGGYQAGGQEPTEGVREQLQQMNFNPITTGGATSGTITSIAGSNPATVVISGLGAYNGEHCCIRDLPTAVSGTYSAITTVPNTPVTGVTTINITGSGFTQFGIGPHSAYNSTANSNGFVLISTNLCFTIAGAQNDGYDTTLPVNSITSDTILTLIPTEVGSQTASGWAANWPTSGSYTIHKCAFPSSFNKAAGTMTTADASGLTTGDAVDQTLAYNLMLLGVSLTLNHHIGRQNIGGGFAVSNVSTVNSPYFQAALSISGKFLCGMCIQYSNQPTGPVLYHTFAYSRPSSGWFYDWTPTATGVGTYNFFQYRDSLNTFQNAIMYNTDTTTTNPGLLFFNGLSGLDTAGNIVLGGVVKASNISSGPYSNQVHDSTLQSVCASGCTWTSGAGPTYTINAGPDVMGGNTALQISPGSGFIQQITTVSMTAGNTYAMSFYAQTTTGTALMYAQLYQSGSNTACHFNVPPGMPANVTVTTTLTKFTFYCTASAADTMRVTINTSATTVPVNVSMIQVAGSPWCTTNCTTTGPPIVTGSATVSGSGLIITGNSLTIPASGTMGVIPTAAIGKVICETTTHTLGHCSTQPDSTGACTCN